jgi:hypothetical protein
MNASRTVRVLSVAMVFVLAVIVGVVRLRANSPHRSTDKISQP